MKKLAPLALLTLALLATSACTSINYSKGDTKFQAHSLFSNSIVKGLTVEGTTKTTSQGLRITSSATEPNVESITASGAALGELIGTAAKSAVKP